MTNYPGTVIRSIRIPDDIWEPAQARAAADGTTVTAVVITHLKTYIAHEGDEKTVGRITP